MADDGNRLTDTVRARFSASPAAEPPGAPPSAGGSHAVTANPAPATPDATQKIPTVGPDRAEVVAPAGEVDRTQAIPTVGTATAGTGSGREATASLEPEADQYPGESQSAAPMSRQRVLAAQKERYGGIKWGAAFFGWLSANGLSVLLVALLSAGGVAIGLTQGVTAGEATDTAVDSATGIGLSGGIALLVLLFLSYLAGGYVAGRMARFNGAKQGVAVWVIGLVVVLLLALAGLVFGSKYNVLSQLDLPRIPVDEGTATTAGIIALAAVLAATLAGAIPGGIMGPRYHRKVDRVGFDAVHAGR